jgi:ABC-2 type transport system ATP-binding protein
MIKEEILRAKGLSKGFGKKAVLENIDLEIKKAEIFGLIGASGAGKTTLLSCLVGFLSPDQGHVAIKINHTFHAINSEISKEFFGFAAQTPSFYEKLTVYENLAYFGTLYNVDKDTLDKNIDAALRLVGLYEEKANIVETLSGGMQKRLDIAIALVHNPEILILDEPTANLDIVLRKQMWDLILKIKEMGTTVIIASHFLSEMEHLCDRVAMIHTGKIYAQGTIRELRHLYRKEEKIVLETVSKDYELISKHLYGQKVHVKKMLKSHSKLLIYSEESKSTMHTLMHVLDQLKDQIVELELKPLSLDEIFEDAINKK